MQKPTQNLSDNKAASPNFVRSSQESSSTNSLMTNTNDATKGKKNDKSSKIEQIETYQTSNIKDEETDDNNIPPNKIYMHCHTPKTKHWRNKKKTRFHNEALYYIT